MLVLTCLVTVYQINRAVNTGNRYGTEILGKRKLSLRQDTVSSNLLYRKRFSERFK